MLNETKNQTISPDEIKKFSNEILNWEKNIKESDNILSEKINVKIVYLYNFLFQKEEDKIAEIERKKLAENEKIKGNESMQSKDFDEALRFYNNSIKLNSFEPTTYCNRSLTYIKLKQFEKGLSDCNKAIDLNNYYSKAYYRRALCYIGINKFRDAFEDFLYILSITPNSPEILEELKNLKNKWLLDLGKDEWNKLNMDREFEAGVDNANKGIVLNRNKIQISVTNDNEVKQNIPMTANNNSTSNTKVTQPCLPSNTGFKKIKIIEETHEDPKKNEKIEEDIEQELSKIIYLPSIKQKLSL